MPFLILKIAIYLSFLIFIARVLSYFEKCFVRSTKEPVIYVVRWSLPFFKLGRLILFLMASIEAVLQPYYNLLTLILGICLSVVGIYLRIAAIKELGSLWSYHACLYKNHYLINTGVYKWLQHPAYIGNIHIPGLILSIGSPLTAIMSFFIVTAFYLIRIKAENQLLSRMMENRGV